MTYSGKIGSIGGMVWPPIKLGYDGWVSGRARDATGVEMWTAYLEHVRRCGGGK